MKYMYYTLASHMTSTLKPDWFFLISGIVQHNLTRASHGGIRGVEEEVVSVGEPARSDSRGGGELGQLFACLAVPQSGTVVS